MLNCPWKGENNVISPYEALFPIFSLAPRFQDTKASTSPDKVKSHSKRNSGDLPSKTLSVVRTEMSELLTGPRGGVGRVHVMVASTAQRKWSVNTTYSGPGYLF